LSIRGEQLSRNATFWEKVSRRKLPNGNQEESREEESCSEEKEALTM
jgi:hypothetical protein